MDAVRIEAAGAPPPPEAYPADVVRLTVDGREIILVGTAHISRESADLVRAGHRRGASGLRVHRARRAALRGAVAEEPLRVARPEAGHPAAAADHAADQLDSGCLSAAVGRQARGAAGRRVHRSGDARPHAGHSTGPVRPRRPHHATARLGHDFAVAAFRPVRLGAALGVQPADADRGRSASSCAARTSGRG